MRVALISDRAGISFLVAFGSDDTGSSSVGPPSICACLTHFTTTVPLTWKSDARSLLDTRLVVRWGRPAGHDTLRDLFPCVAVALVLRAASFPAKGGEVQSVPPPTCSMPSSIAIQT